jgi:hypothetical protein
MKSKALLFGLNYKHCSNGQLKGCINDTKYMAEYIKNEFNMPTEIYTDDKDLFNTSYGGILCNLYNLAIETYKDNLDFVWIHYSGHGSSVKDVSGDEKDGNDEALVPSDYETKGFLIDDYIHKVFEAFNPKTKILFICDSCHSGTMADIKYSWNSNKCTIENNNCNAKAYIVTISGCMDNQTSADAYNLLGNNENIGALTASILKSFKENPKSKNNIFELVNNVNINLKLGGFSQYSKLCSTYDLNKDATIFNNLLSPNNSSNSVSSETPLLNDISIDEIINEYTTIPPQQLPEKPPQQYQQMPPINSSQPVHHYYSQAHVIPTVPYRPPSQSQYYFSPIKPQSQYQPQPQNNSYSHYLQNDYQEYKPNQYQEYKPHQYQQYKPPSYTTPSYKRNIDINTEQPYQAPVLNTPRYYRPLQVTVQPSVQHISTPRYIIPSQTYIEPSPRYVTPQIRNQLYNQYYERQTNKYNDVNNNYQQNIYYQNTNEYDNYRNINVVEQQPVYKYKNEMYC